MRAARGRLEVSKGGSFTRRLSNTSLGYESLDSIDHGLKGATVLVTGSTDGIGRHTAALLAQQGATVLLHGRTRTRVQRTLRDLRAHTGSRAVFGYCYDLSSLRQTREFGEHLHQDLAQHFDGRLHCLVNNAGVFNEERQVTEDGLEETWQVNVAAPFLLTSLLLGTIDDRIINSSSVSYADTIDWDNLQGEKEYGRIGHEAYSRSKLAVTMWTFALAAKLKKAKHPAAVHCIDPGATGTKLLLAGWGDVAHGVAARPTEVTDLEWAVKDTALSKCTGKYWVNRKPRTAPKVAYSLQAQQRLWDILTQQTGAEFPFS